MVPDVYLKSIFFQLNILELVTTVPNIYAVHLHDDLLRGGDKNKAVTTFFFFHDGTLYSRDKNVV
jgi:hypothetical protein